MTADRWTQAVRNQLGLGRLLPLGGPHDGAWITEAAATAVLRRTARDVRGVRLTAVRLSLTDPDSAPEPAVPPPPSALPPGPLRITADFAATPTEPLPATASVLRTALTSAATDLLGLTVTEVDLRVTGLLEKGADTADEDESGGRSGDPDLRLDPDESRVAAAVRAVPGVTRLGAVHIAAGTASLPRRHVRVEFEAGASARTLDVARAVRTRVTEALPDHPSVAALVTAVTPGL
ncbi:nucleopolyhedrovirus P10 family protein [Streptomyces phaeochromogenes]|uniref:Nucleopolyhedrovirus P10 family protein n=1 Tax=Streptomyces phaeochromogenes TaxID=1923 RepID=A0ABZ1HMI3_STRPH|nr:nucleopolyhedrovirus P10 family protein [Streptomyces phaeochromogenes]WSD18752.1 nucleopolyhedrovirus P10 family protein [Streptomyces phaeochromogenes]